MIKETYLAEIEIEGQVETEMDCNYNIKKMAVNGVSIDEWIFQRLNFLNDAKIRITIEPKPNKQ